MTQSSANPSPNRAANSRVLIDAAPFDAGKALRVAFDDGSTHRFHAFWLRDNADDPTRRDPGNGQKLVTFQALNLDETLTGATLQPGGEAVLVQFANSTDQCQFSARWLQAHAYDHADPTTSVWLPADMETWAGILPDQLPSARWSQLVTDPHALCTWLGGIHRMGAGRVVDGPTTSGCLLELVKQFGFVRETNYGKWFEVRSEASPVNLAYTARGLQAHTDNPYRDPAPTMQLLYCLADAADGGESVVVDGFAAALELRERNESAFDLLRRYPARFAYSGAHGVQLEARQTVIETAHDGRLQAIHFNNRSAATVTDVPYEAMRDWYGALQQFAAIIDEPERHVEFKLSPGDGFLIDNTRVLHARKAFKQTGARWLQGCYPDRDGLLSTWRVLKRQLEEYKAP